MKKNHKKKKTVKINTNISLKTLKITKEYKWRIFQQQYNIKHKQKQSKMSEKYNKSTRQKPW